VTLQNEDKAPAFTSLRHARTSVGFTLDDLSVLTRIDRARLSRIERGYAVPLAVELRQLQAIYRLLAGGSITEEETP